MYLIHDLKQVWFSNRRARLRKNSANPSGLPNLVAGYPSLACQYAAATATTDPHQYHQYNMFGGQVYHHQQGTSTSSTSSAAVAEYSNLLENNYVMQTQQQVNNLIERGLNMKHCQQQGKELSGGVSETTVASGSNVMVVNSWGRQNDWTQQQSAGNVVHEGNFTGHDAFGQFQTVNKNYWS